MVSPFVHNAISRTWDGVSSKTEGWPGESARERHRQRYGTVLSLTLEQGNFLAVWDNAEALRNCCRQGERRLRRLGTELF
jgi:hypothetical protein